jgi:hypothetical protein
VSTKLDITAMQAVVISGEPGLAAPPAWGSPPAGGKAFTVAVGLGRIVASHYRSPALDPVHEHMR